MIVYKDIVTDQERAFYGAENSEIIDCTFDGPADGESALKESSNISVVNCDFRLRYPLWHVTKGMITNCTMTEDCRAALWYDSDITIINSKLHGIKAVRECRNITIEYSDIISQEFGWYSTKIIVKNTDIQSEYPFLNSSNLIFDHFTLKGKYSFQYVKNVTISNSNLDTKDAFWHAKNVTVTDSVVQGEYLGWYSENLTFKRCKIIGTQPLCYAKNLVLEECEMVGCDLSFEKSEVKARIKGSVDSVKNPAKGYIHADEIGEIIIDEYGTKDFEIKCRENSVQQ